MGRGRQKAKDAKIARELKYTNHGGDLRALERELISGAPVPTVTRVPDPEPEVDEYYDRWAEDDDK
jgi:hypothetical protein